MSGFLSITLTFHHLINIQWGPLTKIDLNNFAPSSSSPNGSTLLIPETGEVLRCSALEMQHLLLANKYQVLQSRVEGDSCYYWL